MNLPGKYKDKESRTMIISMDMSMWEDEVQGLVLVNILNLTENDLRAGR